MRRVGLAGYGSAGRGIHAPLLERAGLEVVAVATSSPERVTQVRDDRPDTEVVPDLDALLERDDLDLVVLATPTRGHGEQALACIDAGVPVVVDKPLALTGPEARHVVESARRAGVLLTVFQNRRYDPSFRTLQRAIADGALGDVTRIELRWERWRPQRQDRWRETASSEQGGGLLLDLHTHLIDQAVLLAGPVTRVYATLASRLSVAEDDAVVVCTHESGVVSYLSATSLAGAPGPRIRVLGREGAFVLNQFESEPNVFADLADSDGHCGWLFLGEERHPVPSAGGDQADFYRAVDHALVTGDPADLPVDPMDAVRTLEVIDAARLSARTGDAVRLAPR
ncbi:MAG: Gfo/Idh/MocA family oxidoreductase [Intrasporangiaceae bacterium]|nr:Gfo/Idh/MocA family oxidoreductase [Intrasporangiaceae bacterium]